MTYKDLISHWDYNKKFSELDEKEKELVEIKLKDEGYLDIHPNDIIKTLFVTINSDVESDVISDFLDDNNFRYSSFYTAPYDKTRFYKNGDMCIAIDLIDRKYYIATKYNFADVISVTFEDFKFVLDLLKERTVKYKSDGFDSYIIVGRKYIYSSITDRAIKIKEALEIINKAIEFKGKSESELSIINREIKIEVKSKKESKEIQKLLFEKGYKWNDGTKDFLDFSPYYETSSCLFLRGKRITYSNNDKKGGFYLNIENVPKAEDNAKCYFVNSHKVIFRKNHIKVGCQKIKIKKLEKIKKVINSNF